MDNFQGALEAGNRQIIEMPGGPMAIYGLPYGSYGNLQISTGTLYMSNQLF